MKSLQQDEFLAQQALLECLCLGAHLQADAGELHLYPYGAGIPEALLQQLKHYRKEVLALLQRPSGNVMALIQEQANITPDAIALICNEQTLSYAELISTVAACVNLLSVRAEAMTGQRIVVLLPRSVEMLVWILALFSMGSVVVPLDSNNPNERLLSLLEQADPLYVICDSSTEPLLAGWTGESLLSEATLYRPPQGGESGQEVSVSQAGQCAYLLFTSGSTGTPKGVLVGHTALNQTLHALIDCVGISEDTRMLAMAPVSFDIAWLELLAPLMAGGQVHLLDDRQGYDVGHICHLISTGTVNCVQATPSRWKLLLTQGWQSQPQLTLLCGGEALPADLAHALWLQQGDFWNLYGPTEATIWAMAQRVTAEVLENKGRAPGIGKVLPHMFSSIKIPSGCAGGEGELCLGGAGLAIGYFRNAAATEMQFVWHEALQEEGISGFTRWYHTGDLVQDVPGEGLAFLGRVDRQVKVNGYRIELQEIEQVLKRHTSVADAVLIVEKTGEGIAELPLLVACVVAVAGSHNKTGEKLNAFLCGYLPDYMLPARYRFIEQIPLTANGKVDYSALSVLSASAQMALAEEGNDSIAGRIKHLICTLLELEHLGLHDSFFDVGGSSILAATLLMTINNEFGTGISLATMLERPPTIARLTLLVERHFDRQEAGVEHRTEQPLPDAFV